MRRSLLRALLDCASRTVSREGSVVSGKPACFKNTPGAGRSWLHTSCAQHEVLHHGAASTAHVAEHGKRSTGRWLFLAAGSAGLVGFAATSEDVRLAYVIPTRLARDVLTAAAIVYGAYVPM